LSTKSERREGVVLMSFEGEMDISEADRVDHELRMLEEARPPLLILDLRGLTFLDSTGLRLMLQADSRAREQDRRVAIVPGPEVVHRIFLIAKLDKRLEFIDSPEAAGMGSADEA
jgi:anti-sigma B factor antagonist